MKLPVPPVPACLPTMSLAERDFRDLRVLAFPEVKGTDATLALRREELETVSNDTWQVWSAECASPFTVRTVELPSRVALDWSRARAILSLEVHGGEAVHAYGRLVGPQGRERDRPRVRRRTRRKA